MHPIRQIYEESEESPDVISIPEELRRRRIELILWPLDEMQPDQSAGRRRRFHIADVDTIYIPSRVARNARR